MKKFAVTSVHELIAILADFDGNVLYRGQTSHYEKDGAPSITTSFDRQGCVPPVMLKWARYARNLLEMYLGDAVCSMDFTQALLQHYGWRSFYIDCSASALVSAWFASHRYRDRMTIEMCEDFEERPIWLSKHKADYEYEDGEGVLYIFDKSACEKHSKLTDLASIKFDGMRPRTQAQQAWLLGPLRKQGVAPECLVAMITGPRSVFREFAATDGLTSTEMIFPNRAEDPLLNALLSIPWKEIPLPESKINIPAFARGLDIPEYHESFEKFASPATALFRGKSITANDPQFPGNVVSVPAITLFGSPDKNLIPYPYIEALLSDGKAVAFEIDDLILHMQLRVTEYQKGIVITPHKDGLFEVSQLIVTHPGQELTGVGVDRGWYYRRDGNGLWRRENNSEECPCDQAVIHERYFEALKMIEHFLGSPRDFSG